MRRCVGVLILCLMVISSAYATNSWTASSGSWGSPPGGASSNWSSGAIPTNPVSEQVKIVSGNTCTVDAATGATGVFGTQKLTVGTTSAAEGRLEIVSDGTLNAGAEVQVGDDGGYIGRVTQTGGLVNLTNGTSSAKLEVGYKQGVGYYTISGGTIQGVDNYSQLLVGASGGNGGTGTFTVQGDDAFITVSKLYVGASTSSAQYTGNGTLAFEIDGGISPINAASVYIDPNGGGVASLSVLLTGSLPSGNIILVNNTGTSGVFGAFDNIAWGGTVTLGGVNYTLTNTYIGGVDGLGNDVALIPEPATIALFGLGLLALRRKR